MFAIYKPYEFFMSFALHKIDPFPVCKLQMRSFEQALFPVLRTQKQGTFMRHKVVH